MRITIEMMSASRLLGSLRRLRRQEEGSTAIEFAIVSTPFLMFIFGLVGVAFYFFIMSSVEKGMDQASRLVRTGQAVTQKMTVDQFKQAICDNAGKWVKCDRLQLFVSNIAHTATYSEWASVTPHSCVSQNQTLQSDLKGSDYIAIYSGAASDVVIVTACYKWDFAARIPFLRLGNMSDGSLMMQSLTAFRSEPYPGS